MKIVHAYYESRSFTFEAFGQTEIEATDALIIGLLMHTKQFSLDPDWWELEGIETDTYEIGLPYRDRELIKSNKGVK